MTTKGIARAGFIRVARAVADTANTDRSWMKRAKCQDRYQVPDPNIFHPERGRGRATRRQKAAEEAQAVAICGVGRRDECPVWRQCRAYAFATDEPFGVWGGLTEDERGFRRA